MPSSIKLINKLYAQLKAARIDCLALKTVLQYLSSSISIQLLFFAALQLWEFLLWVWVRSIRAKGLAIRCLKCKLTDILAKICQVQVLNLLNWPKAELNPKSY